MTKILTQKLKFENNARALIRILRYIVFAKSFLVNSNTSHKVKLIAGRTTHTQNTIRP